MKKIGIICSSGGHLTEALSVMKAFQELDKFLIIHDFPVHKNIKLEEINRIYKLKIFLGYSSLIAVFITNFLNIFQLIKIFWIERPYFLFSTGAEIAIIPFYLGKIIFRSKLIFLESLSRVNNLSFTGKLIYPISDLFLVQWPELLKKAGPKAIYRGKLI